MWHRPSSDRDRTRLGVAVLMGARSDSGDAVKGTPRGGIIVEMLVRDLRSTFATLAVVFAVLAVVTAFLALRSSADDRPGAWFFTGFEVAGAGLMWGLWWVVRRWERRRRAGQERGDGR